MKTKKSLIIFFISMFFILGFTTAKAQGEKNPDINESKLKSIIGDWLQEHDHVCLPSIIFGEAAIDSFDPFAPTRALKVKDQVIYKGDKPGALAALEAQDIVTPKQIDNETIYTFTKKGEAHTFNNHLCYAKRTIDTIVKWRGPGQEGAHKVVYVYFIPRLELDDWAKNSLVQEKFPAIQEEINKITQNKVNKIYAIATLVESNIGWDVVGLQFN